MLEVATGIVTDKPCSVLQVITRLNVGGAARQALLLTRDLPDTYSTFLVAGKPPAEEGELHDPLVTPIRAPLVRPIRPVVDARAMWRLRRLVRLIRPQIVHTHMAKAGAAGRAAALTSRVSSALIHTFHGHVLTGYFTPPLSSAFVRLERALASRTDALVAVSTEIRDELQDLGIGEPARWHVIAEGVDLDRHLAVTGPSGALRSRLELRPDVPLVATAGRLVPIKDHETLLRAMQELPGVHLAVLGGGELRSQLQQRASDLGLHDRTHFTGWWPDMPAAFSDVDVVALTSVNEGTPNALIEAHACGRPIVATDVGGVKSVVTHNETGFLVPARDPAALADRLRILLASPSMRQRFGETGRKRVAPKFGRDRLVRDTLDLYRDVLARRRAHETAP